MEATKQTEAAPPTPEQLLKLLEIQLQQERSKRAGKSRNRATALVIGILFIIAAASITLIVARQLLVDLRAQGGAPPLSVEMSEGR